MSRLLTFLDPSVRVSVIRNGSLVSRQSKFQFQRGKGHRTEEAPMLKILGILSPSERRRRYLARSATCMYAPPSYVTEGRRGERKERLVRD